MHEPAGGTVYLCAVDEDGMAVSIVQSLFERFGSGIAVPGTGVVLNNRCFGFAVTAARWCPGRRPYHTIIPGMLLSDGELDGPFGVMGGFIQAQAHVQLVHGLLTTAWIRRPRSTGRGFASAASACGWSAACGTAAEEVAPLGLEPVAGARHLPVRRRTGDPAQPLGHADRRL